MRLHTPFGVAQLHYAGLGEKLVYIQEALQRDCCAYGVHTNPLVKAGKGGEGGYLEDTVTCREGSCLSVSIDATNTPKTAAVRGNAAMKINDLESSQKQKVFFGFRH